MKLYYFADGCSLATHISLREAGIVPQLFEVDVQTRQIANEGGPFPLSIRKAMCRRWCSTTARC